MRLVINLNSKISILIGLLFMAQWLFLFAFGAIVSQDSQGEVSVKQG